MRLNRKELILKLEELGVLPREDVISAINEDVPIMAMNKIPERITSICILTSFGEVNHIIGRNTKRGGSFLSKFIGTI